MNMDLYTKHFIVNVDDDTKNMGKIQSSIFKSAIENNLKKKRIKKKIESSVKKYC